ncbi:MAG: prohibitin family protein, partial [Dehalococcoidales bacterium]|nr:prohibitin family protein [Dehalococcoidales bacterium]
MTFLLVIGIIVLVIGLYIWSTNKKKPEATRDKIGGMVGVTVGIILILVGIIAGSFTTIPAGQRGVVIRFGAVTGTVLDEGLKTKLPFVDSVVKMTIQTQKYEADAASASRDLQDVSTTIALNYKLDPGQAAEVYRTLGLEYIDRIAAPAIQETIKQVTARYNAEDLILRRDEVKNDITNTLSARLLERGIITEAVSITEFRFSTTFTAAIEAKVAAEQAVFEATNKLARVKVEAQQAEEEAIGIANARIAKANGEAEYIR